jgi:hypothetical protein
MIEGAECFQILLPDYAFGLRLSSFVEIARQKRAEYSTAFFYAKRNLADRSSATA